MYVHIFKVKLDTYDIYRRHTSQNWPEDFPGFPNKSPLNPNARNVVMITLLAPTLTAFLTPPEALGILWTRL